MKKRLVIFLCIASGLIGLFMSGCGGLSIGSFMSSFGEAGNYAGAFLWISIPSLVLGLIFLTLAIRGFKRMQRNTRQGSAQEFSIAMSILVGITGLLAGIGGGFGLYHALRNEPEVAFVALLFMLPGLVLLAAGIAGIAYATAPRTHPVLDISEAPGTHEKTPDASSSRRETP